MSEVQFSPSNLKIIGGLISKACASSNELKGGLDSIKNTSFSFPTSASSGISNISNKVDDIVKKMNNLNSSYNDSAQLLLDMVEQNAELVNQDIVKYSETGDIKGAIEFFFGYQDGDKRIRKITEEELRAIFEKNGAKVYFNNAYEFEVDGVVYRYDVKSHKIENYVNGKLNGSMNCMFYVSEDSTFEDITNTITVMCGTGTNRVPEVLEEMSVNNNTMVAVGYGNDNSVGIPQVVAGITRTCNYFAGHNTSNDLNNSIVGYSLGGLAAFKTASNYPGLYKKIVTVNSASYSYDEAKDFIDNYDNLAGIEIIMVEANKDKFGGAAIKTIGKLKEHGLGDNVSIYTNSDDLQGRASEYLDPEQIHDINDDFADSHMGWDGHGHGFEMLVGINVFSYLSA